MGNLKVVACCTWIGRGKDPSIDHLGEPNFPGWRGAGGGSGKTGPALGLYNSLMCPRRTSSGLQKDSNVLNLFPARTSKRYVTPNCTPECNAMHSVTASLLNT